MLDLVENPPEWSYVLDFLSSIAWPATAVAAILVLKKPIAQLLRESESGAADLRNLTFSWKKAQQEAKDGLTALEAGSRPSGEIVTPPSYAQDVRPTLDRSPRDAITRLYAELVQAVDGLDRPLNDDEEVVFGELARMHAGVASGKLEANDKRVHEYQNLVGRFLTVVGGSAPDAS
jgi:hypothetical protein